MQKKWKLFMKLFALLLTATTLQANAAQLLLTWMTETWSDKNLVDTYFYTWCYSPVIVDVNPEWVSTNAIDAKLFLSWLEYQDNVTDYTWFTTWVFNTYHEFNNNWTADWRIWSWTAQNWSDAGSVYWYINATSSWWVNWTTNKRVAIVYMKPTDWTSVAWLNFYYLWANQKSDDSNVSSWTENNTQYVDALTSIAWTWTYNVSSSYACPYRPYLVEWSKYLSTLWHDLTEAATNKDDTSLNSLAGYEVIDPTSPQYSWTITHRAWPDLDTWNYTSEWSWDIWTKTWIVITLTWNEYQVNGTTTRNIKIDTNSFWTAPISISWSNDRSDTKTLIVTWNVSTWLIFYNRIWNQWKTYQSWTNNYYADFQIDVFWHDTLATSTTTWLVKTWEGYAYVALTGIASSSSDAWDHADFTTDDDKFRIIKFSWYNIQWYWYDTTTWYNAKLNELYVTATWQNFTMQKNGLTDNEDPQVEVATDTGAIMFTQTWSWMVYISDIAWNVTWVFVSVDVQPKVEFEIKVSPAFRDSANDLSTTWDFWFAYKHEWSWTFGYNSETNNWTDPEVAINSNWTWSARIRVPASWDDYLVVFKWSWMLSVWFTWVWTNDINDTSTNYFDLSWWTTVWTTWMIYPNIKYASTRFEIWWDVSVSDTSEYDLMNSLDLSIINSNITIWAFDNSKLYMDFDLNSVISAIEQAIEIQYNNQDGWMTKYADGTNYPAEWGGWFTNL